MQKYMTVLTSKKPDIFLTLSDGEPADANAVKMILKSYKSLGIKMTAIGVGRDTFSATSIASNLKILGYDKVLAVSSLRDIPNRVLSILSDNCLYRNVLNVEIFFHARMMFRVGVQIFQNYLKMK